MDSKEVDDVARRIAILVEAVRSDVRTAAEGLVGVSWGLAELRADVQKLERKVESESDENTRGNVLRCFHPDWCEERRHEIAAAVERPRNDEDRANSVTVN